MPKTMALAFLLWEYRPGSYDWTWQEEFDDIQGSPEKYPGFDLLVTSIQEIGIQNPILLGDDGRVWDGHKRITAAETLAIETVPVVLVRRSGRPV